MTAPNLPQFVIWTRYQRPDGKIVRHVYGPYPTRSKAQTDLKKMLKDAELYGQDSASVEAAVCKLLNEENKGM